MVQVQHWNPVIDMVHRGPWWRNRRIIILNLILSLPLLTSAINGYDSSVLNGLQLGPDFAAYFKYNQKGEELLGFLVSAQNVGALVALPVAPTISDTLGRRRSLSVGSVIMVAGVALQCTARSLWQLILARGIIGCGLNIALNAAPLLITELAFPTQRGKITAMYNSFWYFGSVVAAWACYGAFIEKSGTNWAWRIPSLIQAGPSVLQLIFVWFVPESPRWLISKGRVDDARKVLAKYHSSSGDVRDPLVVFEITQIQHALRMEKELAKTTTFLTLVSTPGNRRRMRIIVAVALFSQWSGNGLVSYYLGDVLTNIGLVSPAAQNKINGSLQAFNFVVAMASSLLVEKLGRRTLFLLSTGGMLVLFSMNTLLTALNMEHISHNIEVAAIVLIFLFFFAYDLAYTPLLVSYAIEILPFNIRAKGFAVMNIVICFFLAFNQFVNPVALKAIDWKYYLFYVGWLAFELAFVFRYIIETRGRTLEETAVLFDGEQPALELQQVGRDAATISLNELQAQQLRIRLQDRLISQLEESRKANDLTLPASDAIKPSSVDSEPIVSVLKLHGNDDS